MSATAPSDGNVLHVQETSLVDSIRRINASLAPLLVLPQALQSENCYLSVKVLNKFSDQCVGTVKITGMMIHVLLPALLEIVESQSEALCKQRGDLQRELGDIQVQLRSLGFGDRGGAM